MKTRHHDLDRALRHVARWRALRARIKPIKTLMTTLMLLSVSASLWLWPSLASAQGFTPPAGSLWMKLGYIYAEADANFAGLNERVFDASSPLGHQAPFRSRSGQVVGGQLWGHQAALDVVWSPVDRVVLGGFVPLYSDQRYQNQTNNYSTRARGVADVTAWAGYQLAPSGQRHLGLTAYARLKMPTSFKFPYTDQALLGEGQIDASIALAASFAFLPALHLNTMIERRHRFAHRSAQGVVDPGQELHALATLGGSPIQGLWLTAGYSGFQGQPWLVQLGQAPAERLLARRFHAVLGSAYLQIGQWLDAPGLALDAWIKLPLAGRDHAVTTSVGLGLAYGL